jgi:serine/threonine protein phosphatase PrpC
LLSSDGLSDNLSESEIVETLRKGPLTDQARSLAADTTNRMTLDETSANASVHRKPDDLTFLVFRRTGWSQSQG